MTLGQKCVSQTPEVLVTQKFQKLYSRKVGRFYKTVQANNGLRNTLQKQTKEDNY